MAKFLTTRTTGPGLQEATTVATAGTAGQADRIPALDANGRLDISMMPAGIAGADTVQATATEALAAGDFVNLHAGGVRKADNSNDREANGYVIAAVANAAQATVYCDDVNTLTGLTVGTAYYLGTGGAVTATQPTAANALVQFLGRASSTTQLRTQIGPAIRLA